MFHPKFHPKFLRFDQQHRVGFWRFCFTQVTHKVVRTVHRIPVAVAARAGAWDFAIGWMGKSLDVSSRVIMGGSTNYDHLWYDLIGDFNGNNMESNRDLMINMWRSFFFTIFLKWNAWNAYVIFTYTFTPQKKHRCQKIFHIHGASGFHFGIPSFWIVFCDSFATLSITCTFLIPFCGLGFPHYIWDIS